MKEEGKVIRADKDLAVIEITPSEKCTKCCSCGASKARQVTVTGENATGLAAGQRVKIDIESSVMMRLYLMIYAVPLAVFVATVIILHLFTESPIISFTVALAATILVYMGMGYFLKRDPRFSPTVTAIE
jgi:positive regulator of sigma E activity